MCSYSKRRCVWGVASVKDWDGMHTKVDEATLISVSIPEWETGEPYIIAPIILCINAYK